MSKRQNKRTRRQKKTDQVTAKKTADKNVKKTEKAHLTPWNAGREEFLKYKTKWPEHCTYTDLDQISLYSEGFAQAKWDYIMFDLRGNEFQNKLSKLCKDYGVMINLIFGDAQITDGDRVFEFCINAG